MFLKQNSIQDILDQATDVQSAHILLALLNVVLPEKEEDNPTNISCGDKPREYG